MNVYSGTSDATFPRALPDDEQKELAAKAQAGDLLARNRLITHSLGLVIYVINKHAKFIGSDYSRDSKEDIFHHCIFWLATSISKYNPDIAPFRTYAYTYIKFGVADFKRRNSFLINPLKSQGKRRVFSSNLFWLENSKIDGKSNRQIAEALNEHADNVVVTEKDVQEVRQFCKQAFSLNAVVFRDEQDNPLSFLDVLTDATAPTAEDQLIYQANLHKFKACLDYALFNVLDDRERYVIINYTMNREGNNGKSKTSTLKRVGQRFGVCRERIRQIQNKALLKLRGYMEAQGVEYVGRD